MQLHEFQAKGLFRAAGLKTARGIPALTPEEADKAIGSLALPVVVKAQVHAGGRGKAGGIQLTETADEARAAAARILGMTKKLHEQVRPDH